jgi:hypothetical protein
MRLSLGIYGIHIVHLRTAMGDMRLSYLTPLCLLEWQQLTGSMPLCCEIDVITSKLNYLCSGCRPEVLRSAALSPSSCQCKGVFLNQALVDTSQRF